VWLLLVSGVATPSSQGGPPVAGTNSTLSILIQTTFEIDEFLLLPIGLILLVIAFLYINVLELRRRQRGKQIEINDEKNPPDSELGENQS
jgi:hypothetical protein